MGEKSPWASDRRRGKRNHFEIPQNTLILYKSYPHGKLVNQSLNCRDAITAYLAWGRETPIPASPSHAVPNKGEGEKRKT